MVKDTPQTASLVTLMSFSGGYVDTASFMSLHGLFAAHVTGNFVTLGASLVLGTSGTIAKLLALPVFCCVIMATRLLAYRLANRGMPVLRLMLLLKLTLLSIAGFLIIRFGPFSRGDSAFEIFTGMTLVSAMAIQNAAHRIHLSQLPPTTLMTGTTTQIMIDIADLIHGIAPSETSLISTRLIRMTESIAAFASGCAVAALFYSVAKEWCFLLPIPIAIAMLMLKLPAWPPAAPLNSRHA